MLSKVGIVADLLNLGLDLNITLTLTITGEREKRSSRRSEEVMLMSVALVTGASRGFGRALAIDLAKTGWSVVIDARHGESLRKVKMLLESMGAPVISVTGDLADPDHRSELIKSAGVLGGLDLLVNNASELGPTPLPALENYDLVDLRRVYEVNVFAPLGLVQAALPILRRSHGTIVSLSSDAAVKPYEGWGGYGPSKAALDQLHQVLAAEEPKLLVYQFDPGDMQTDMHRAASPSEDLSGLPQPEAVVPALRRLLDVGAASGRYLASDWARS
jgi:NAD(P)-dependent dehydrogenase (short-subunit alcohol dehydrogenase family)